MHELLVKSIFSRLGVATSTAGYYSISISVMFTASVTENRTLDNQEGSNAASVFLVTSDNVQNMACLPDMYVAELSHMAIPTDKETRGFSGKFQ
jgi:hypothetical protein